MDPGGQVLSFPPFISGNQSLGLSPALADSLALDPQRLSAKLSAAGHLPQGGPSSPGTSCSRGLAL